MEVKTSLLDNMIGVGDMVLLEPLNEETFINNLKKRFDHNEIYVSIHRRSSVGFRLCILWPRAGFSSLENSSFYLFIRVQGYLCILSEWVLFYSFGTWVVSIRVKWVCFPYGVYGGPTACRVSYRMLEALESKRNTEFLSLRNRYSGGVVKSVGIFLDAFIKLAF